MLAFPRHVFLLLLAGGCSMNIVQGIPLLGGRFETTTDVQTLLNLALDAADLKETSDINQKKDIYENGVQRGNGQSNVSLQSLSLNAKRDMSESPIYNIFRHAFLVLGSANEGETGGFFDGASIDQYADTIVNDLFDLEVDNIETEAALVMNVWMKIVHELFQVLTECSAEDSVSGLAALDKVAALWIGEGQVEGSNENGHLLYVLAEKAGERFDQDDGEAEVNTKIIDLFLKMQLDLTSGKCDTTAGYVAMRDNVKRLLGLMTVPLIQNLIHHTMNVQNEGGSDFVELYALATIPRVAACDPAAYDDELHLDVLRELTSSYSQQAIAATQKAFSCLGITCADVGSYMGGSVPQCQDPDGVTLAGYSTNRDGAREKSYLDRDVLQIEIFLKFEAYGSAMDWYTHGWNAAYSLQALARNEVIPSTSDSLYALFQSYYGDVTYPDTLITNIIEMTPPYNTASTDQVRHLVTDTLKYVVSFLSTASALQFSIQECYDSRTDSALQFWDTGAMMFIGSMEGELPNGNELGGEFLYTTAKELCAEFSTCVDSLQGNGDVPAAAANEVIMAGLNGAINSLNSGSCDVAKGILESQILPTMAIPLLQGTLKYASFNAGLLAGTADASLAIGYAFSRAVLPLVDQALPASAETIKNQMEFQLTSKPVSGGFGGVADALRQAFSFLATSCADIGVFEDEPVDGDICDGSSQPQPTTSDSGVPGPAPTQSPVDPQLPKGPDDIAFRRYIFTSTEVADGDGSFALDVRDMFNANSIEAARGVYENGSNALTSRLTGEVGTVSLESLSTEAAQYMSNDPMFSIFKFALYEEADLEDFSGEDFLYADDVVSEALSNAEDNKLAAESAVIMNVWMVIAHRLYSAVRVCKDQDPAEALIDSAVALWIGKEQGEGQFDSGWMLYSVGQSAAKFYGLEEQEAPTNTELMNLFIEAQSTAATCVNKSEAYIDLRKTVSELIRTLTKPLVLSLLFHMVKNSKNMVELYALSVIPQAAACNPDAYDALETTLFTGYDHTTSLTDEVKGHLASFLRCQRITCDDMQYTNKADSGLQDLVQTLCNRLDYNGEFLPMAGYFPKSDVSEIARLDLDILEITILTQAKAYSAALDVYRLGLHSISNGKLLSLQSLATSSERDSVLQFQIFNDYFGSKDYADDIIIDALQQTGDYHSATRGELAEIVFRSLQSMVMYMAMLSKMQFAVMHCIDKNPDQAQLAWDTAVALFIGSIDGPAAGLLDGDGESMYSLGNEICEDFDTCEGSGESSSNEKILFQLAGCRDAIADGQCDHVERTMTWEIIPRMAIPLIQGMLAYAIDNEDTSDRDPDSLATVHILAQAVTPLVKEANDASATTLDSYFGDFQSISTGQSVDDAFDAIANALRGMGVDCEEVGTSTDYPDLSLCSGTADGGGSGGDSSNGGDSGGTDGDVAPLPDTNTNLGGDLYVTSTYVQDKAKIALDVEDMLLALNEGSYELAKLIYTDGKNSEIYDENGKFVSLRSLKGFSVDSSLDMVDEPLFNIYEYALQDSDGNFMSREVRLYADTLVEDTFQKISTGGRTVPAEAAVALNLWMHVVHLLHETLRLCKKKELRNDDGVHSMDVAVAYWIGDGQVAGDGERGHLLYAFAEQMGDIFNMDDGGQSRTNTNILRLFNEAKNEISLPGACSESPASFIRLRRIVNNLESQMAIPLIQGLIHHLRMNNRDRVKVYAHAVVPFFAGCSPSSFAFLQDKLINLTYNVIEVESIVEVIRSIYHCLGLQCDDIGVHESEKTEDAPVCEDIDVLNSLAGYKPASDVREYGRLDLDLRELDILMQMKAYTAAEDLYLYGRHVKGANGGSLSFSQLATTSERSIVPEFDAFVRYYGDEAYADRIIRSALADDSKEGWTDAQRRVVVVKSAQVLVMYFGALQAAYEAISDCTSTASLRSAGSSDSWDKAAAMMIGHLEGTETNGTVEGYMYYNLAQEHCKSFGTCLEDNTGVAVNDQLVSLLYSGRGAVLGNSCRGLKKAADEISSLLLVPVIQGALLSSIRLSSSTDLDAPLHRAEAYVYSRALLPLVDDANRDAATTIDNHLGVPGPQSTKNTASEVFASFAKVYPRLGVDCDMVGDVGGYDACSGVVYESSGMDKKLMWIIIGASVGFCVCCCCVLAIRSRGGKTTLPENNPKFVASEEGELNHSMDLLEKAFSTNTRPRASTSTETVPLAQDMHTDASPLDDDDFEEAQALKSSMGADPDII
jgi:hypothetical protein